MCRMRFHIFCPAHIQISNKILEEKLELATKKNILVLKKYITCF